MERLKDFFYDNQIIIIASLGLVLIILTNIFQYYYFNREDDQVNGIVFEEEQEKEEEEEEYIYIDIRGEVKSPGVYKILANKRVIDAISLAGGLNEEADTSVNNLSLLLKDEMVIIIYSKQEVKNFIKVKEEEQLKEEKCSEESNNIKNESCITQDKKESKGTSSASSDSNTLININTASFEELTTLNGIGEKKAQNIIEYRTKTPFTSKEQLLEVSGIGEALYNKIKDSITV